MTFKQRLLRVELSAQVALIACAVLIPVLMATVGLLWGQGLHAFRDVDLLIALSIIVVAYLYGLLPVVLYGAPVYALLEMKGRASWLNVIAVGVTPGLVLAVFTVTPSGSPMKSMLRMSLLVTASGLVTSVITHWHRTRAKARECAA